MASNLADAIAEVLQEIEAGTPQEIYDELGRLRPKARNADVVATVLRANPDRFVERHDGWSLVGSVPSPTPNLAREPYEDETVLLETELRKALRGLRMVAEIGLDAASHQRVDEALSSAMRRHSDIARVGASIPAILTVYLVGHGVYHYDGSYWPSVTVAGVEPSAGPVLERALRTLRLETFEEMVLDDGALRYLGPILAHGGVPKYCLPDFFRLLESSARQAADAASMLSVWRTRKAAFAGIDVPVRRFLTFGGDLAVDFVDRSLDMMRSYALTGTVPAPREVGLPPYVVRAFRDLASTSNVSIESFARKQSRLRISIDPWDGAGPLLELPPVPDDHGQHAWRVHGDHQLDRIPASRFEHRVIRVRPSRAWSVELLGDSGVVEEHSFEGVDTLPALFFDPATGALLRPGGGLRTDDVWLLTPASGEVRAVGHDGSVRPLAITEQLPEPGGAWSGYQLFGAHLSGLRAVSLRSDPQGPERRIVVHAPTGKAALSCEPLDHVTTGDGSPVYPAMPEILIPSGGGTDRQVWRTRVSWSGGERDLGLVDLVKGEVGYRLPEDIPLGTALRLAVRGPLGSDLRTQVVVFPGLVVSHPDRLLFPGDRAVVSVGGPGLSVDGDQVGRVIDFVLPEKADELRCLVASPGSAPIEIVVRVSRVLWSLTDPADARIALGDEVAVLSAEDLDTERAPALVVQTGRHDVDLTLSLVGRRGGVLQQGDLIRPVGREGRWLFDLRRFKDTIARSDDPDLSFVLVVGQHPVTVARVRLWYLVENLEGVSRVIGDFTQVSLRFSEHRAIRNRVARLWSRDRPWARPVTQPIPDGQTGTVVMQEYERIPPGSYLAEIAVDDGWTAIGRPNPGDRNVLALQIGTRDDARRYLKSLSSDDLDAVLEFLVRTGRSPRRLEVEELREISARLVQTHAAIVEGFAPTNIRSQQCALVLELLAAEPAVAAEAIVTALETGLCGARPARVLVTQLMPLLSGRQAQVGDSLMRSLWAASPPLAACLDCGRLSDADARARLVEFAGWDPNERIDQIKCGEPVTQIYVGMPEDQLRQIRRSLDLVPREVLGLDVLVAANLEWLANAKQREADVVAWWTHRCSLAEPYVQLRSAARRHLKARRPPPGTVAWAGLPGATLGAALRLVSGAAGADQATWALQEAVDFAPQLVDRDLVLAQVLIADAALHASE